MDKQSIIYTKARLNREKIHRNELEKLNDACAACGDKYEKFYLRLEKFGVYTDSLKIPAGSERYF